MGPAALLHSATTTPKVARANLALRSWSLFLVVEVMFHEEMNGRPFSCAWLAFSVFYESLCVSFWLGWISHECDTHTSSLLFRNDVIVRNVLTQFIVLFCDVRIVLAVFLEYSYVKRTYGALLGSNTCM